MSKIHIISTPEIYFLHFRRDDKGKYSKHKNFFPTYTKRKDGEKLIFKPEKYLHLAKKDADTELKLLFSSSQIQFFGKFFFKEFVFSFFTTAT